MVIMATDSAVADPVEAGLNRTQEEILDRVQEETLEAGLDRTQEEILEAGLNRTQEEILDRVQEETLENNTPEEVILKNRSFF